ncbi:MAG: hypothetical protein U0S12_05645 [Fimbriimonadales bacterium]
MASFLGKSTTGRMTVRRLTKPRPRITVLLGEQLFLFDPNTYRIDGYTDLMLDTELRTLKSPPSNSFSTNEQIWRRGEVLMRSIVPDLNLRRGDLRTGGEGSGSAQRAGRLLMTFEEQPGGWRTMGNGNRLQLELDSRSGAVVSFAVSRGWSYGPATAKVSSATAVRTALSVARGRGKFRGVQQYYVTPNAEFGSEAGRTWAASRQCRLAFVVDLESLVVLIDCNTGDCIGGMEIGASPAESSSQAEAKTSKEPLPAHAVRFLRLAGFPYEGWSSTGRYLGRVQLYSDRDIKQNGSIGFTDELVYHFRSPFSPFGSKLKPIKGPEEACRRAKELVASPPDFKFTAKLEIWDAPTDSKEAKGTGLKDIYIVEGRSPRSDRTYGICMWADTGAVFMYDMDPRPETGRETTPQP